MVIIPVNERQRIVISPGVMQDENENWVDNPDKTRISLQRLRKNKETGKLEWRPGKGVQFSKEHKDAVAKALTEV